MIVRSSDGKIIGDIENRVFRKRVRGSVHLLKTPPAWAIDAKAFGEIYQKSDTIRIEDTETGAAYEISTQIFNEKKVRFRRKFGEQYFVTLNFWHEIRQGQKVLL